MNHFHFPSAAVPETIDFYTKHFAFREIATLGKTHVLRDDKGFLLAIDESAEGDPPSKARHLGFHLEGKRAVLELFLRLKPMVKSPLIEPSPRVIHFYCEDPSGNRLEIGWYHFEKAYLY